tara:strand:- start:123 stop:344 length:222 start_codon:yes stop_codon:yes gene_type:complete
MILTKEYRLVWDTEIILYGEFALDTQTETLKDAYECDTQEELDDKVIELGFAIPVEPIPGPPPLPPVPPFPPL